MSSASMKICISCLSRNPREHIIRHKKKPEVSDNLETKSRTGKKRRNEYEMSRMKRQYKITQTYDLDLEAVRKSKFLSDIYDEYTEKNMKIKYVRMELVIETMYIDQIMNHLKHGGVIDSCDLKILALKELFGIREI
jgi:uncharacterized UBP type Zn finger protein